MKKTLIAILFASMLLATPWSVEAQRGGSSSDPARGVWPNCTSQDESKIAATTGSCPKEHYFCKSTDGETYKCQNRAWTKVATVSTSAPGSGDVVTVGGTNIDTTANFVASTDVTWSLTDGGAGGPDDVRAFVEDDSHSHGTTTISGLTDADVSDTLTCSLFVGSGSTTTAIDLATNEVAGLLPLAKIVASPATNTYLEGNGTWSKIDLGADVDATTDLPLAQITGHPGSSTPNVFLEGDGTWNQINLAGAHVTGRLPVGKMGNAGEGAGKWLEGNGNWTVPTGGSGDVTSAVTLTNDFIIRGDSATSDKNVQLSGVAIDDTDNITGVTSLDIDQDAVQAGYIQLKEITGNGSNFLALQAPDIVTNNVTWILPDGDSSGTQCLASDGAGSPSGGTGNLSWTGCSGTGDITDVFDCASGNCASIALSDTDLLDMSAVSVSTATEGLILPQHATDCSTAGTAEGQVCWEADADTLYIGDGFTVKQIGAGSGDITDVFNCASGDCSAIALADGDALNMASVDISATGEGLILPQHATDCSTAGGTQEGQVCWEKDDDTLWVGDGTTVTQIGAGGAGDITDVFNCSTGDCGPSIALADGDLLDMSSVSVSGTTEGIILPQHATDCSTAGAAEGQVCWEADADTLYIGNGATVTQVSAGAGDITDVFNCSTGDCGPSIALADGDLLDMSSVAISSATEGMIMPQHATDCSTAGGTAEGQLCWEADDNTFWVGNGATVTQIGAGVSGDITDVFNCASGDCGPSIALADGDLLDMSGVTVSGATEGLILPQHATDCSSAGGTAEGQLCWEVDANTLWIGDGAAPKSITALDMLADAVGSGTILIGPDTSSEWEQVWRWTTDATSGDAVFNMMSFEVNQDFNDSETNKQHILRLARNASTGNTAMEGMLFLQQKDADAVAVVDSAIKIESEAGGITTLIEAKDNTGDTSGNFTNFAVLGATTITMAEVEVLDGTYTDGQLCRYDDTGSINALDCSIDRQNELESALNFHGAGFEIFTNVAGDFDGDDFAQGLNETQANGETLVARSATELTYGYSHGLDVLIVGGCNGASVQACWDDDDCVGEGGTEACDDPAPTADTSILLTDTGSNGTATIQMDGSVQATWDVGGLTIGAADATDQINLPISNDPLTPTLEFGSGEGFYQESEDINVAIAGVKRYEFNGTGLHSVPATNQGFLLRLVDTTTTIPSIVPDSNDTGTGLGSSGTAGEMSLISGGTEAVRLVENSYTSMLNGDTAVVIFELSNAPTSEETDAVILYAEQDAATTSTLKFRDDSGNVTDLERPKVKDVDFIPIGWCTNGSVAPESTSVYTATNEFKVRNFSGTVNEDVECAWSVPHDIDVNSDVIFQVMGVVTQSDGPGDGVGGTEVIAFTLQGDSYASGDPISTNSGSPVTSSVAEDEAQSDMIYTDYSGDLTIGGIAAGEMAALNLIRLATTTDTYPQDFGVIGINIKYTRIMTND